MNLSFQIRSAESKLFSFAFDFVSPWKIKQRTVLKIVHFTTLMIVFFGVLAEQIFILQNDCAFLSIAFQYSAWPRSNLIW